MRHAAIAFGRELERRLPGQVTTNWWKEERGERIFVDYNQNARDRTIASAYSVRPKSGAPVSAPLAWGELEQAVPEDFTVRRCPPGSPRWAIATLPSTTPPTSLEPLLEMYERDLAEGRGDMPTRPNYPKMPGEPMRVQAKPRATMSPLPLSPPIKPQLALSRKELPRARITSMKVKLDGFRCVAFVDGDDLFLQSRSGKPLGRYFPELVPREAATCRWRDRRFRGEDGAMRTSDALGQRIHPAASRIERLSVETPAVYVVFDCLARGRRVAAGAGPCPSAGSALQELLVDGFRRQPRSSDGNGRDQSKRPSVGSSTPRADRQGVSAPYLSRRGARARVQGKRVRTIDVKHGIGAYDRMRTRRERETLSLGDAHALVY